ncbi:hypothetical protein ACFPOG_30750 [Paenibacillus aestuarii]|uniref:Uncharacterized protein n=1 Tax=Paenibacillus aestuarii TaxID=516965 RepID=A0ABW0KIL7_9BACL
MNLNLFEKTDPKVAFWKWFKKRESFIEKNFESLKEQILDEISDNLKKIDENLAFEISHSKEGQRRKLIISADGMADSFHNVIDLCNMAPVLDGWIIIAFRPRMNSKNLG